jgi:hypothetical protein
MADWQTQCWDSTVFISLLTGQVPERVKIIRALLDHHTEGKFQIVLSTFAIAEVRKFRVTGSAGPTPGQGAPRPPRPLTTPSGGASPTSSLRTCWCIEC